MAELAAVLPCTCLMPRGNRFKSGSFVPPNARFRINQRKHFNGGSNTVSFPSGEMCVPSIPIYTTSKGGRHPKELPLRCCCFGVLVNAENTSPVSWVPVVDQVLLMTTIAFAYMAGVIPYDKVNFNARKNFPDQTAESSDSTSTGSAKMSENQGQLCAWDEVKRKLLDALDAIEYDGNLVSQAVECENSSSKTPLSLYAIAEGPRLRLLWATLQQLQKEVNDIAGTCDELNMDGGMVILSETVKRLVRSVYLKWVEDELHLESKEYDKANLTRMLDGLKGDATILQCIRKLGKEGLYADMLFFLKFCFPRPGCLYDSRLLTCHGVDILEDLVINLADGITSMYLELISVDSDMSSEMGQLGLSLCSSSTRALQKLRNEVALNQWLHQNIFSVVSMYEDKFDMFTLQTKLLEVRNEKDTDKLSWWKKIILQKPAVTTLPLAYIFIKEISVPVKRTKELRGLSGWKYYYSLCLELSDISMPLIRAIVAKVSSAVSFFLVCLIGRSLGLIYTGIRQALGWK